MSYELYCERCGRQLDLNEAVWLRLRSSTNTYHATDIDDEWVHSDDDQGEFPFGAACARRMTHPD